jgi:hypothetical protein
MSVPTFLPELVALIVIHQSIIALAVLPTLNKETLQHIARHATLILIFPRMDFNVSVRGTINKSLMKGSVFLLRKAVAVGSSGLSLGPGL